MNYNNMTFSSNYKIIFHPYINDFCATIAYQMKHALMSGFLLVIELSVELQFN